jgi:hypothetical protein
MTAAGNAARVTGGGRESAAFEFANGGTGIGGARGAAFQTSQV